MDEKICSFFGHRTVTVTEELYAITTAEIWKAVALGCRTFYFGGFGEFDALCLSIVKKIKEEHPILRIKSVYCVWHERYLRKPSHVFQKEDYDEIVYITPAFEGWYKSIYFRNCAMIDQSDFVIFFAEKRENSGAYKAYKYALSKKGKAVANLYAQGS